MRVYEWVGRTIISQYGLICKVLDVIQKDDGVLLKCRDIRRDKIWEWDSNAVTLVTHTGELLDLHTGEIYGEIMDGIWKLYPESKCRILSSKEVDGEWEKLFATE